jgi:hypothetical protein
MDIRRCPRSERGPLGQVAGETQLPRFGETLRALSEGERPARQASDLCGDCGVGGRFQVRRIAVVPAAIHSPDVADHELGLVVDRTQVGALERLRRQMDGVEDLIETRALVHQGERFAHQSLEGGSDFAEDAANALAAGDRQAVGREQEFGFEGGHLAQRPGPLDRIALHLLWVPGVRKDPGDEVAGADRMKPRNPGPQMVVGLAFCVV